MEIIYLALLPALLVYMLDFGMGEPGNDSPNVHGLLSFWPQYLAKQALKKAGAWDMLYKQYLDQVNFATDGLQLARINTEFKKMVFQQGRELFTWQYAAGMCPICFHFWINIFFIISVNIFYFEVNIITFIPQLLIGHFFIRLFKKHF